MTSGRTYWFWWLNWFQLQTSVYIHLYHSHNRKHKDTKSKLNSNQKTSKTSIIKWVFTCIKTQQLPSSNVIISQTPLKRFTLLLFFNCYCCLWLFCHSRVFCLISTFSFVNQSQLKEITDFILAAAIVSLSV